MIILRNKEFSSHDNGFILSDKDIYKKNEKSDLSKLSNKQLKALGDYEKVRNSDKSAVKAALIGGGLLGTLTAVPGAAIGGLVAGKKGAVIGGLGGGAIASIPATYVIGKEHLSRKRVAKRARKELEKRGIPTEDKD